METTSYLALWRQFYETKNFNSANADWLEIKDNNQVLEELSKFIYSL